MEKIEHDDVRPFFQQTRDERTRLWVAVGPDDVEREPRRTTAKSKRSFGKNAKLAATNHVPVDLAKSTSNAA